MEIQKALEVLRNGGVILYPTDTVWGIGCDATDPAAVAKVYEIKKQGKRYDEAALSEKIEYLLRNCKELHGMRITQGVLTLEDM